MPLLNPTRSRTSTIVKNNHKSLSIGNPRGVRQKHDRWPHAHHILTRWPSRPDCSPYDVLEQPKNGPYNKRRFYELVMVYHPDRWIHGTYHDIPKQTRVERYRLILDANAILSDPVRRRAYDEYGVGWTPAGTVTSRGRQARPSKGSSDGGGVSSRSAQATWENMDGQWREQSAAGGANCHWQQQSSGSEQRPIFMRNSSFAVIVLCLASSLSCLLSAVAFSRAESISRRQNSIHKRLLGELDSIAARRYKLG
ncbi:hypothetical protein PspLS_11550 [Pyricularia sp. CBS 133598]|nr:hypothetical protein PspLS_11550 [Pyricularia sp. CBS 133598]